MVEADAVTPCAEHTEPVDLIEAVLTSAQRAARSSRAGGSATRTTPTAASAQNVPVAAAVSLGATNIYAVVAMALDQPPDPTDFSKATLFDLLLRST